MTLSLRGAHCSHLKGGAEIQTPVGTATDSCFLRDIDASINSSPLSLCLNPGPWIVPHSFSSDCNFAVISWWEGTLPGQPVPRSSNQGVRTFCSSTYQSSWAVGTHTCALQGLEDPGRWPHCPLMFHPAQFQIDHPNNRHIWKARHFAELPVLSLPQIEVIKK